MAMDENTDSMASLNRRRFLMGSAASGLILGYAGVNRKQIQNGMNKLSKILKA